MPVLTFGYYLNKLPENDSTPKYYTAMFCVFGYYFLLQMMISLLLRRFAKMLTSVRLQTQYFNAQIIIMIPAIMALFGVTISTLNKKTIVTDTTKLTDPATT